MKLSIGDKVRVKSAVHGYYSGYGITPVFLLTPDLIAVVKNPKIPCVRKLNKFDFFCLVEFLSPVTSSIEQAALYNDNIIKVKG